MRVFLTGASGFLGAAIAMDLACRGLAVTCFIRPESHLARLVSHRDRLKIVWGDLDDPASLTAALVRSQPDTICHAAWCGVFGAQRNDPGQAKNVTAAIRLARAAADVGVTNFVGIGSQAEYGPLNHPARETDPDAPTTRYGAAKTEARKGIANICAAAGMRFAWVRAFSLYGPGDNPDWLLPYVIRSLLRGEKPALTPAEQRWDFLHVADAARAVADVLSSPVATGCFNMGSGSAPPLRRTIEMLRDIIDPTLPLGFGEIAYRPDQVMWLQADITRLSHSVGWQPRIALRDGLEETIARLRRS